MVLEAAIQHGWSLDVLVHQTESGPYRRRALRLSWFPTLILY
jgi:hypothetical protein